jgi:hypothetical protein
MLVPDRLYVPKNGPVQSFSCRGLILNIQVPYEFFKNGQKLFFFSNERRVDRNRFGPNCVGGQKNIFYQQKL